MFGRLDSDISVGAIALVLILVVGGVALVVKGNGSKAAVQPLPVAHRELRALPENIAPSAPAPHPYWGPCLQCHPSTASQTGTKSLPNNTAEAMPAWMLSPAVPDTVALSAPRSSLLPPRMGASTGILTPSQQQASQKMIVEGHWVGMEVIELTPALRKIYKIPAGVSGVIVDEITLASAESGILAGDVITDIQGRVVRDLNEYARATEAVRERERARVAVHRQGSARSFTLVAKNTQALGAAQMEGAPPIKPGALSPHRDSRRGCTDCHVIMITGGQLPIDAGDVLPTPPAIGPSSVPKHEYRGKCRSCHVIQ